MDTSALDTATPPCSGHATDIGKPAATHEATVPPFWQRRHNSTVSYRSLNLVRPPAITLEDHTEELSDAGKALWAKHASVDDYVVVSGSAGLGAYVVWNCTVETLDGGSMTLMKRYSEFDELRQKLVKTFPNAEAALPLLPPKSVISKFRPKFLEKRRAGLSNFLNCVLLNPEFSGSPVLKEFIFK